MFPNANFGHISECASFTAERLSRVRSALAELEQSGIAVVVNGSYARGKASEGSDFDYFLLVPDHMAPDELHAAHNRVKQVVTAEIGKEPSAEGAFSAIEKLGEFAKVIGGQEDTNQQTTRRMLFLTEGKAVCGQATFEKQRKTLVTEMYIREGTTDHQLGLFLLNDIIRYGRTMCVDFENKTVQNKKPWGIRNIKLVFSRKLLYFAGVLICAELAQRTLQQKRDRAVELMDMTPLERVIAVCGRSAERALEDYDYFLGMLRQSSVRADLDEIKEARDSHSELFRSMKNRGHHFSMHLISALDATYPAVHPIHKALIM